jgi:hypothetical protein
MSSALTRLSLNTLLVLDAATCALMGLALMAGASTVSALTDLPAPLLFWAGALLLPIAAFMAVASRGRPVAGWAAGVVIAGNVLWVAASLLLPASGLVSPNALGWAFLAGQAGVVAVLAILELSAAGARRVPA